MAYYLAGKPIVGFLKASSGGLDIDPNNIKYKETKITATEKMNSARFACFSSLMAPPEFRMIHLAIRAEFEYSKCASDGIFGSLKITSAMTFLLFIFDK
ncbi:MAG TPA: hypothetical protein VJB62_02800 [Patescibacteria group bacterium]|nr:hypothetical protein [Patescibacteria group bacterium]